MATLVSTVLVLMTLYGIWSSVQVARKIPSAWRGEQFTNPIHARHVSTRAYIAWALVFLPLMGGLVFLCLGLIVRQSWLLYVGGGLVVVSYLLIGVERMVRKRNRPRWLVPPPLRD